MQMQDIAISIIFACMIVFPFFIASLVRAMSPKRNEAALKEAISKGHVVTAKLKKIRSSVKDPQSRSAMGLIDLGIYEYEYKGRKYKYKLYSKKLPYTVTLYFLKSPRKAVEAPAMGRSDTCWPVIIAVIACIIYLLGKLSAQM